MGRMTYFQALEKAEHLIALGNTDVYLDEDGPWAKATRVEGGACYRFNSPTSFYVIAEEAGLTFKWNVEMEKRDANGRGVTWYDRERIREAAMKMPPVARKSLAAFLTKEVLPDVQKRTGEIREALNAQLDSEDCLRGLIAFADEAKKAA